MMLNETYTGGIRRQLDAFRARWKAI